MDKRISVISIIVYERDQAAKVNAVLHEYADYIIGRMGLPYEKKGVSIISVVMDAPMSCTSALSGKLGMIDGVTAKFKGEQIYERDETKCKEETGSEESICFVAGSFYVLRTFSRV